MYSASDAQGRLHSDIWPYNHITLLSFPHATKHTQQGIVNQNRFDLLRQFVPFSGPVELFQPE